MGNLGAGGEVSGSHQGGASEVYQANAGLYLAFGGKRGLNIGPLAVVLPVIILKPHNSLYGSGMPRAAVPSLESKVSVCEREFLFGPLGA